MYIVILLVLIISLTDAYLFNYNRISTRLYCSTSSDESSERYQNLEKYDEETLKKLWDSIPKALISVGSKGVQSSHCNSLCELLSQHNLVKVKVSSDRLNTRKIAQTFSDDENIIKIGELIECRKREFLFKKL